MNISRFIAQRITFQQNQGFTKLIIKIGIVAVALAVSVMIISTSLFKGFKSEISEKVFNFWGHIHISDANTKRTFEAIPIDIDLNLISNLESKENQTYQAPGGFNWFGLKDTYKEKKTIGGIENVTPFIILPAILETNQEFEGIYLRGLTADYSWNRLDVFLKDGHWIEFNDTTSRKQIIISQNTANRISRKVGDKLIVNFILEGQQMRKRMEIIGIYNTGIEEYDKQFAIVDMDLLQESLGWSSKECAGYEVILDNEKDMAVWNEYIYIEELPSRLYSETIREKFDNIFGWLNLQDINERVIFLLMIIVAIITMITTYLILILERANVIAVLKSLGATNFDVVKIFLYCATYIIVRGMIIGNLLGLGICLAQKYFKFIRLDEANYLLDNAPVAFDWPMIVLINMGVLGVTLFFLLIPSVLISSIKPVKIFRFN